MKTFLIVVLTVVLTISGIILPFMIYTWFTHKEPCRQELPYAFTWRDYDKVIDFSDTGARVGYHMVTGDTAFVVLHRDTSVYVYCCDLRTRSRELFASFSTKTSFYIPQAYYGGDLYLISVAHYYRLCKGGRPEELKDVGGVEQLLIKDGIMYCGRMHGFTIWNIRESRLEFEVGETETAHAWLINTNFNIDSTLVIAWGFRIRDGDGFLVKVYEASGDFKLVNEYRTMGEIYLAEGDIYLEEERGVLTVRDIRSGRLRAKFPGYVYSQYYQGRLLVISRLPHPVSASGLVFPEELARFLFSQPVEYPEELFEKPIDENCDRPIDISSLERFRLDCIDSKSLETLWSKEYVGNSGTEIGVPLKGKFYVDMSDISVLEIDAIDGTSRQRKAFIVRSDIHSPHEKSGRYSYSVLLDNHLCWE